MIREVPRTDRRPKSTEAIFILLGEEARWDVRQVGVRRRACPWLHMSPSEVAKATAESWVSWPELGSCRRVPRRRRRSRTTSVLIMRMPTPVITEKAVPVHAIYPIAAVLDDLTDRPPTADDSAFLITDLEAVIRGRSRPTIALTDREVLITASP
jgi:hypothetical protein